MGGQQDHFQSGPADLQFLQQTDAVELVHAQVRDHQVGPEAAGCGQGLHAVFHRLDFVVLGPQAYRQQPQQPGIIIDDQDARLALDGGVHFLRTSGVLLLRLGSMLAIVSSLAWASSSW